MSADLRSLVKSEYESSYPDATALFQTILDLSTRIGLGAALALLEDCVFEKRLAWFERAGGFMERSADPLRDGYRLFYEKYLHVAVPQEGEIVEAGPRRMVTRWWNRCPTLEACQKLGLDTRVVCRQVYERPVEALLSRLDPRLRFRRNYAAIRPYTPYCEEILEITT
ncbi:MAG TPA: hypothetical protein VMT46_16305 [Anaerolineaceae bacterium]|nr:hypothetical protein [Anaerolineaceae bacterium]